MGSANGGSFTSCCGSRPEQIGEEKQTPQTYSGSSLQYKRASVAGIGIKTKKSKSSSAVPKPH